VFYDDGSLRTLIQTPRRTLSGAWLRLGFLFCIAAAGSVLASSRPEIVRSVTPETARDKQLEEAIGHEVGNDGYRYSYNHVSLSGGRTDAALVYLSTPDDCGSGGCILLVFEKEGEGYRLVSRITLIRTPVVVSSHVTNGRKDLIVFVSGGGTQPGYDAVLAFDGYKYPENPTVSPAVPLKKSVRGVAYLSGEIRPDSVIVVSPRR